MGIQDGRAFAAYRLAPGRLEVEAELGTASAATRLVRYHFAGPLDVVYRLDGMFRMDLCLTARHRSARASFRDRWSANRFEPIGDIFLVPPGVELLARTDDAGSLPMIVCEFDARYVEELTGDGAGLGDRQLGAALDIRAPAIRSLLLRAARETRHAGFAGDLCVELLARQIAIELVRHFQAADEAPPRCGLAPWQLRRIDERLELAHAPTLTELAELCRLSVRQLARSFRASRGRPLGAYVADSQFQHAKQLLAADASVASIARTLGFALSSSFCAAFRRATGMAPDQFRRTLAGH
jgi:AraC family transcriptional regulator